MMIVAILILVIIILVWALNRVDTYEDYLYGFWVAQGDEFCEKSGIDSMMLFIGEPAPRWPWQSIKRQGYLIILDGICNQGITIKYSKRWFAPGLDSYTIRAEIEFDADNIWPDAVNITVNMLAGTLMVTDDDGIEYASLFKQHDITNIAAAAAI